MTDTDTDAIDTAILEWHRKGVGPGGIANVLEAMGMGKWTAKAVGDALKRLGIKADTLRAAEAVFAPGEGDEGEGWAGHCGDKFTRPWLDRVGRDVRDTGCAGEQGGEGEDQPDSTFADRAVAASERAEEDDQDNPFGSTVSS